MANNKILGYSCSLLIIVVIVTIIIRIAIIVVATWKVSGRIPQSRSKINRFGRELVFLVAVAKTT